MDNLFFSAITPPEVVLSRFELCRTHDLEEARRWGDRIFCGHRLRSLDGSGPVNARLYYRPVGGIGIGRLTFGSHVTIEPDVLDSFALIQMPICGQEMIEYGNERVLSTPKLGSILNAESRFRINHGPRTEKLIVRVDRSLLERHCQQHLGRTLRKGIEFQTAMPLDTPEGLRWMRMIGWLYDSLSNDDELPPLLVGQFESTLVTMLLACQPHTYSEELCADPRASIAPAFVKRVERYIEEHAHEPISIVDMAEYAGVSSRSLFTGFRRFRNTSPMLYLKEVRLRYVQEELQRQGSGSTTVTAVAYRWGFSHLGHFTTDYKRRFGESPSETLAR